MRGPGTRPTNPRNAHLKESRVEEPMKGMSIVRLVFAVYLVAAVAPQEVRAQGYDGPQLPAGSPFRGGVPQGQATAGPIALSAAEVIRLALDRNLGVLV